MITEPIPFEEALENIRQKVPNPQSWDSRAWALRGSDVRLRSFFSARVENAAFLERAKSLVAGFLEREVEDVVGPDGVTRKALRVASRDDFVLRMREFMIGEGMASENQMRLANQDDVQDIKTTERLRLIFDTNVRQAYGFGQWKQGMTPAALRAFPAARLIRERNVGEPRPRHQMNLGEVRMKTDPWWSDYINSEEIGGFGVPWGPYGFNSGVNQEDVPRSEAKRLGLPVETPQTPEEAEMNENLRASVRNMSPEVKDKLRAALERSQASRKGKRTPQEAAREAAARARQRAAQRNGGATFQERDGEIRLERATPPPAKREPIRFKTEDEAIRFFKDSLGVDEVVMSAGKKWKTWGKKIADPAARLRHMETVADEWSRLLEKHPGIRGKVRRFYATDNDRGRANLDGPAPNLCTKAREWKEKSWEDIAKWEAANGRKWGTERKGSQVRDNFRHELGHVLSTPDNRLGFERVQMREGLTLEWFRQNVSEYAATNEWEAIAEAFGIYTRSDYASGTLPKALEVVLGNMLR